MRHSLPHKCTFVNFIFYLLVKEANYKKIPLFNP